MNTPLPIRISPTDDTGCYETDGNVVSFNGKCNECRPYCGTLCCIAYEYVALSEEEAKSGLYRYIQVDEGCDCAKCEGMRAANVQYSLIKNADRRCSYLSADHKCTIYDTRPQTCRVYDCSTLVFPLKFEV